MVHMNEEDARRLGYSPVRDRDKRLLGLIMKGDELFGFWRWTHLDGVGRGEEKRWVDARLALLTYDSSRAQRPGRASAG
jgi:hypothetical protein